MRPEPARARLLFFFLVVALSCACRSTPTFDAQFNSARQAFRQGELAEALTLTDRGLASTAGRPDDPWTWSFRLLRAEILIARLNLNEATALLAVQPQEGQQFNRFRARQKYLRAKIAVEAGELPKALTLLDEAEPLSSSDRELIADAEILGGQVRLRLGRWAEAESRLQAVIDQTAASDDYFHEALALNNMGMGRLVRSRWDEALPWFERVLGLNGAEQLTVYGVAMYNTGICYSRLGQFERAADMQRRAAAIHEHRGSRVYYEQALGELGNSYVEGGDPRKAVDYYRQALAVATAAKLGRDAALWAGNLANALASLGQWDEAERLNEEARRLKIANGSKSLAHNTLFAGEIAAGRGRVEEAGRFYRDALAAAPDDPSVAWDAYAGLGQIALAEHDSGKAARQFETALDMIEKTQVNLQQPDYRLTFLTRLMKFYVAYVDALVDERQTARALEVADSSRARVLAERQGTSARARVRVSDLQALAARWHSAFVFYWLGGDRSYAWVVTSAGVKAAPLSSASDIQKLVADYQKLIDAGLVDPLKTSDTPGDRLFAAVVEPIRKWLPTGASIVIVPDGALHRVNFETLPVGSGTARHYWLEDVEIRLAPSLSLLSDKANKPSTGRPSILLVGNPTEVDRAFPALAYAGEEVSGIAKAFAAYDVVRLEGPKATVDAYRSADPERFSILHFAAHADANPTSPLDSAVILAGTPNRYKLYARDVAEARLRADLVTVSGCRSAGEREFSGEGLIGFAWAFLRSGARRVIAGLWDVDDRSTAKLMEKMYSSMAAGVPPAAALRQAKLEMIHTGSAQSRPYYWGPFELFAVAP